MRMYIGGEWVERGDRIPVVNPYDGTVFDTVPRAGVEDVDAAVASAVGARRSWRRSRPTGDTRCFTAPQTSWRNERRTSPGRLRWRRAR